MEEVRRTLIERYGEQAEDGPHSVYAGGLWVRTSLDPEMQTAARDALRLMEESALVHEALGEHIFDWFLRNKHREWRQYKTQVTPFELKTYLRSI